MRSDRQELMDQIYDLYVKLLTKIANRYENNEIYTLIDHVGYEVTRLEELFRPLWGIAPILREREMFIEINGKSVNVVDFIKDLIINGTDPESPKRFDRNVTDYDRVGFANQATTEIAGYLTCVYFAKDILWDSMSKKEQDQVAEWIMKWSGHALMHSWPNNHYWYPIICLEILRGLGYDISQWEEGIRMGFGVLDGLYIDKGWYSDGSFGRFDYYESWAHHAYTMLWLLISGKDRPDYAERAEKYRKRTAEFLEYFAHYFDEDGGMAAYGRSIAYRFAAVSSFGLAAAAGCDMDYGMAKHVILKNIRYFLDKSIPTKDGVLPVGYLYEAHPFAENYTSEGSNCCYTEGFMCLLCGEDSPLWTAEEHPLPIERGEFTLRCPLEGIGAVMAGRKQNGVTLFNNSIHYFQGNGMPPRFNDMASYYSKFCYNSRSGYSLSSRDMVSSENMISLMTPDGRMTSHRTEILTVSTTEEMLVSRQIPFSNDPGSVITTAILPLSGGFHVRLHRVTITQPYFVLEGGFSVGLYDDGFTSKDGVIRYRSFVSAIRCVGSEAVRHGSQASHPGMHLLAPRNIYPIFQTGVLPAGTYYFASAVYFSTEGEAAEWPELELQGSSVTMRFEGTEKTLDLETL